MQKLIEVTAAAASAAVDDDDDDTFVGSVAFKLIIEYFYFVCFVFFLRVYVVLYVHTKRNGKKHFKQIVHRVLVIGCLSFQYKVITLHFLINISRFTAI